MIDKSDCIMKPAIIDDDDTSTRVSLSETLTAMESVCEQEKTAIPDPSISGPTPASTKGKEQSIKSRKKVKQDKGRPKRPLSAYNVFFQFVRAKLLNGQDLKTISQHDFDMTWPMIERSSNSKRPHRKTHGMISFREMARIVACKWKELDETTKAIFELRARVDRDRYRMEMELWKRGGVFHASPHEGVATVTPEIRRHLVDKEIAYYQATKSNQGLLPALPYLTNGSQQPHRVSLPFATAASSSSAVPVMYQPQVNYPAYQLYPVPSESVSTFHVPQAPQFSRFTTSTSLPLTVSCTTAMPSFVTHTLPPGCVYQTTSFNNAQPNMPNQYVMYSNIPEANNLHQVQTTQQPPIMNVMLEHTHPGIAAPRQHFVFAGNSCSNKVDDVDQDIYNDDIGAFSDDEDDLLETFE